MPDPDSFANDADAPAEAASATATATVEEPAPPAPEPWTPERVRAWNRYLDRYVVGGVLLLVLIGAMRPIAHSSLWAHLRAGQRILAGRPITVDTLSFSREGQRWVNIPWLFEIAGWKLYDSVYQGFVAQSPERAEQMAAAALGLTHALLAMIAVVLILGVRRPGPGLWWAAVCAAMALGFFFVPGGGGGGIMPGVGGLATGHLDVSPETWGVVLMAAELLLLYRGLHRGRRLALWALPLLFLAWANIDESFAFGLVVMVGWILGATITRLLDPSAEGSETPVWQAPVVALLSVAACFANPSTFDGVALAFAPYVQAARRLVGQPTTVLTSDALGFFDAQSQSAFGPGLARLYMAFYLVVVWSGLLSFALNWRRFAPARFAAYVVAAVLWATLVRLAPFFGLVWAATLTLNGQEWYQDRFGTEGRLGAGWKLWSDGGRAATIIGLFLAIFVAITGFGTPPGSSVFGLGLEDAELAFRTADFVRDLDTQGKVMNLSLAHGDALVWRAPERGSFIDNRRGLFPESMRDELRALREALRTGDRDGWTEILSRYGGEAGVTALMVAPHQSQDRAVYQALMRSPHWVPIFDGGNAVLFGRLDVPGPDAEQFKALRLDPDQVVYRRYDPIERSAERPPVASWWIDQLLRYRNLKPMRPQVLAADRWLGALLDPPPTLDPARCLLAIREARRALHDNPDDQQAYIRLQGAYRALAGLEARILNVAPDQAPGSYRNLRLRQRAAALNFAIQTAPPPGDDDDRAQLADLNFALATLYQETRAFDLERDRLQAVRDLLPAGRFPEPLQQRLAQLNEQIDAFQKDLEDFALANQANPVQRAEMAIQAGFPGIAIDELLAVEGSGISLAAVRWMLVEQYCQTGQPDKAYDLIEATQVNDPSLATGPGTAAYRQGQVYALLGNYAEAADYWRRYAIPPLRSAQAMQSLAAARGWLQGEPVNATRALLEISGIPGSPGYVEAQAEWEAQTGLLMLEMGVPLDVTDPRGQPIQGAASHLRKSLELRPDQPLRPLLAYYLEKLDQPVPPLPEPEEESDTASPAPATAPADEPAKLDEKAAAAPEFARPEAEKPSDSPE
jgi:hypothetical protein